MSTSGIRIDDGDDDSGSSGRPEEEETRTKQLHSHPRLSVSVRAGRMEVERRTDKFDYSERNDAKSVSGRLENTPFLTLNVTAAARHSRGTKLPPKAPNVSFSDCFEHFDLTDAPLVFLQLNADCLFCSYSRH